MVKIAFGDVRVMVTEGNQSALLDHVRSRLDHRTGFALATLNLDHMVKLRSDQAFRQAYQAHALISADGMPIVWIARFCGHKITRVAGADIILPLLELAQSQAYKVAFIGTQDHVLATVSEKLTLKLPHLNIAMMKAPSMGFDPTGEEARDFGEALAKAQVDLCFCALGAPKQEIFAHFARNLSPATGFVGIGAGLDFIAGQQSRAPLFVQKTGLEWFWRLCRDPKRMAMRYLRCAAILPRCVMDTIRYQSS